MNKIEILRGIITRSQGKSSLDLSGSGIIELPDTFDELNSLRTLYLQDNKIYALPKSMNQLEEIENLFLQNNEIIDFPLPILSMRRLRSLHLNDNGIKYLPGTFEFEGLVFLDVSRNYIEGFPKKATNLPSLRELKARNNCIRTLPNDLKKINKLEKIDLGDNELKNIPSSIGKLVNLKFLQIDGNPLETISPEIASIRSLEYLYIGNPKSITFPPKEIVARGATYVLSFLREYLKEQSERNEVKLILLGDGREGKTCLSRALRGLEFKEQVNTKGVEVNVCKIPVTKGEDVAFRIWDFEGQEINHQSHHFFLTRRSIYVLVVNGRRTINEPRIHYWLDTIHHRAPGVNVTIVFTECEDRSPVYNEHSLMNKFPSLSLAFHVVGCKNGKGVSKLKNYLAQKSKTLGLIPQLWPGSFVKAEKVITDIAKRGKVAMTRNELKAILDECGIYEYDHSNAMQLMGDLGIFTHFPDSITLNDFIVLKPEWLTKAVSEVLEHKTLIRKNGEMDKSWLFDVWEKRYSGYQDKFYNCMREFELCYPLEDSSDLALVPLRFHTSKPNFDWSLKLDLESKERRVLYRFRRTPPAGLMSRFIVKVHHYIVKNEKFPCGIIWRDGVFLRSTIGSLISEAICEYSQEDRTLIFVVRSAFPQNMIEQLNGYINSVFSFFSGLNPQREYGCVGPNGGLCKGFHGEKLLTYALSGSHPIPCGEGHHQVDPHFLVYGFNSFGDRDNKRSFSARLKGLDKNDSLLGLGFTAIQTRIEAIRDAPMKEEGSGLSMLPTLQQRLNQVFRETLQALDFHELNVVPAFFTLTPVDSTSINPANWFSQEYSLRFYCEHEGGPHPWDWSCQFRATREWWKKVGPLVSFCSKVLSVGIPLSRGAVNAFLGSQEWDKAKDEIQLMENICKQMDKIQVSNTLWTGDLEELGEHEANYKRQIRYARWEVSEIVKQKDKRSIELRDFNGLERVLLPDNTYRWLCPKHSIVYR
ncbi:MAG: COR domain-containing protein [Acidobacteriota bacterium]|nr:COR domain-containing protein [Acidobacteriota bacterium]